MGSMGKKIDIDTLLPSISRYDQKCKNNLSRSRVITAVHTMRVSEMIHPSHVLRCTPVATANGAMPRGWCINYISEPYINGAFVILQAQQAHLGAKCY